MVYRAVGQVKGHTFKAVREIFLSACQCLRSSTRQLTWPGDNVNISVGDPPHGPPFSLPVF